MIGLATLQHFLSDVGDRAAGYARAVAGQAQTLERKADDLLVVPGAVLGEATTFLRDRLDLSVGRGLPKGPFPTMADLRRKFPGAGLPDRLVGTTIDATALEEPGATPEGLMAKAAALGLTTVRLGAYWDRIQPSGPDQADFSQLDALLAAAKRHGIKVVLTVGAKAPCWPEYHVPAWAEAAPGDHTQPSRDPAFRARSLAFVKRVADHVANDPTVVMWQVENEPFDPSGPDRRVLSADQVAAEAAMLRASDGHRRPVMISAWAQGNLGRLDAAFAIADLVGLDVYPHVPASLAGHDLDTPGAWDRTVGQPAYALRKAQQTGKPAILAELQADDWDPYRETAGDLTHLTHRMQALGYRDVLFWRLRQNVENDARGDTSLDDAERQLADQLRGSSAIAQAGGVERE